MSCIFCKIINGEMESNKVFEDENFICILDAFPANEGHCLVIPKTHSKNIFEMDRTLLEKGFSLAKKVAEAIRSALNIENINIIQNNGEDAGQSVDHFHIHIVPRLKNDKVTIKSEIISVAKERTKELKNLINSNLS